MKKLFFILFLGVFTAATAQHIEVNPAGNSNSSKSLEDLIKDVFIGPTCATISNITVKSYDPVIYNDASFNEQNDGKSYSFFTYSGSTFPMDRGVILSTGVGSQAQGPNDYLLSGFGSNIVSPDPWTGDADMKTILDARFGDSQDTNNATIVEFDFVPVQNNFSFKYLFASEEYTDGTTSFECSQYQDGFAFLVSGPGITADAEFAANPPATQWRNIALLADGVTPVSAGTINNNPANCTPQNPSLYVSNAGAAAANAAVNYNGQTVMFTASQGVQAGQTYRMKMVIADRADNAYDSSVFLLAGSFDAGGSVSLGDDVAMCENGSTTLTATTTFTNATYEWQFNGAVVAGETGTTLTATQIGTYTITATEGNCEVTDTIEVLNLPFSVNTANNLILPDIVAPLNDGVTTFDLTVNDAAALMGSAIANVTITYHTSQADADAGSNPIATPTAYDNTANPQTIYARVEQNGQTGCYDTASFLLIVNTVHSCFDVIDDQNLNCLGDCVDLTANYIPSNTTSYNVTSIAYNPQDAFTGLGNVPNFPSGFGGEYNDTPIDLPFTFNYFGNCFTQLKISDTGAITFNVENVFPPYTTTLPEAADTSFNNTILGLVASNMDTFSNPPADVSYGVFGTAPNRRFVISWNQIPDFDCSTLSYTFQVVLYETTNVIEVFVQDKPNCATSFAPEATIGIQNADGSAAFTPPGRNGVDWNASNEAWRFEPSGDTSAFNYVINWYDVTGTLLSTGDTFNVCPATVGTTTYLVKAEDQNNVGPTYSDAVNVTVANASPVITAISGNLEICPEEFTTLTTTSTDAGLTYQWQMNGSDINGATEATYSTNVTGQYSVIATNASGCTATETVTVIEKQGCFIPQGISPNGDSVNDSFDITWMNATNLKMYNRYGVKVYEKSEYRNEWFGQSDSGDELPTGTYYYVITVAGESPVTGWVYVNRED